MKRAQTCRQNIERKVNNMPISEINRSDNQDNTVVSVGESETTNTARVSLKTNGRYGQEVLAEVSVNGQNYFTEDMLATARATVIGNTFTDLYSYTGAGYLINFLSTYETGDTDWFTRVVIDGTFYPLFGTTGVYHPDLKGAALYNSVTAAIAGTNTICLNSDSFVFSPIHALRFSTSLKIQAKHTSGKRYRAGFISLIKD